MSWMPRRTRPGSPSPLSQRVSPSLARRTLPHTRAPSRCSRATSAARRMRGGAGVQGALALAADQDRVAEDGLEQELVEAGRPSSCSTASARTGWLMAARRSVRGHGEAGDDVRAPRRHVGEARRLGVAHGLEEVDLVLADAVLAPSPPGTSRLSAWPSPGSARRNWPPSTSTRCASRKTAGTSGTWCSASITTTASKEPPAKGSAVMSARGEARGQVLAGEAVPAHAQQGRRDVQGERPVAELGQELAHPGRAASQVQDPPPLGDAQLLRHHQERVEEPHVLVAVARGEGLGDVVVVLLLLGVAQDLCLRVRRVLPRTRGRPGARPRRGVRCGGGSAPRPLQAAGPPPGARRARRSSQSWLDCGVADVRGGGLGPSSEGVRAGRRRRARGGQGGGRGQPHRAVVVVEERAERAPPAAGRGIRPRPGRRPGARPRSGPRGRSRSSPRANAALRARAGEPARQEGQVPGDAVAERVGPPAEGSSRISWPSAETARVRARQSPRTQRARRRATAARPCWPEAQQGLEGHGHFGAGGVGMKRPAGS